MNRNTSEKFSRKDSQDKLRAVAKAVGYNFPTGDISELLADIETGRSDQGFDTIPRITRITRVPE